VESLDASLVQQTDYPESRVMLLATAARHTEKELRASLIARAFALVKQLPTDEKRSDALSALVETLDGEDRSVGAAIAESMPAFQRAEVYAALAATAKRPQDAHDMAIRAMEQAAHFTESDVFGVNEQAEIIGSRAVPYVVPSAQKGALDFIASFEDKTLCAAALARIARRLDPELVPHAIDMASGYPPRERARALTVLAQQVVPERRADLLSQSLDAALKEDTDLLNDDTMEPVARGLAEWPVAVLAPVWRRALDALSDRPRPSALASMRSLAPVILRVEGGSGARACLETLRDVRAWWP